MLALIDGDIVTHRVGYTTENEDQKIAQYRADEMLDGILLDTGATEFQVWLSDSAANNFRYKIDPQYKANRVAPKPRHLDFLKEHLIKNWGARIAHDMEADDALGINQDKETSTTVICSIDKDLLMIPGLHYNFVKKLQSEVTNEEGLLSFYRSILVGDVADNIKGVYGIGPKRAEKILPKYVDERDAMSRIIHTYTKWVNESKGDVRFVPTLIRKNAQLLKIKQSEDEELWDSQILKQMEIQTLSFIPPLAEGSSPFMEPTSLETKSLAG